MTYIASVVPIFTQQESVLCQYLQPKERLSYCLNLSSIVVRTRVWIWKLSKHTGENLLVAQYGMICPLN